ncbi:MAG: hypothetical protein HYV60_05530 [Planctomycetia bacterium]|nr:hypothetical protein [Planctomycetia bacterium]
MPKNSKKDCSRCNRGKGEAFWCFQNRYVFDVDMARKLVQDGNHEVMELEPEDVEYSVGRCQVNEGHLAHVDPSIPGIVAHIFFPDDNGKLVHGHRLIDGHHRAARCLQLGIPYPIYVLSEEESLKILMKAPKEVGVGRRHDPETREARAARKRKKARRKQTKAGRRHAGVA